MDRRAPAKFAQYHRWDRFAFPALVALIWFGIVMGFTPQIAAQVRRGSLDYPVVAVHLHAAAFVGWLVFLAVQVTLVRRRSLALHRRLGVAGGFLAAAMVVLGLVAAYVADRRDFGTPAEDAPFASIQIFDMLGFGGLVAAGLWLRAEPAAHKRMMMLATLCLVDAGFSRWWGRGLEGLLGKAFLGEWAAIFLGNVLLIVGLGLYDLATRRRLHPAYVAGAAWALGLQLLAIYLYVAPWWKPIAIRLIGH
jgi:hypothetical protein